MKRLMPASLIEWLAANASAHRADCFVIQLPTGATLLATDGQWDITLRAGTPGWTGPQTTFRATQYGVWTRGAITSEAGTKVNSHTMDLSCVPQQSTAYPGLAIGILKAALDHLFDAATVTVYTAYMPIGQYGTVAGVETKFTGTVTKSPKIGRNLVQFECSDPLYLLNMKVPSRLIQSNCGWSFADQNCSLAAADFTVVFTATAGQFPVLTQPDGYFTQGVVTGITGNNAGLSQTVKSYAAGVLTLVRPFILPIAAGDTFSVIRGCDKTPTTCAGMTHTDGTPEPQDYRVRFGGEPFVPVPSSVL